MVENNVREEVGRLKSGIIYDKSELEGNKTWMVDAEKAIEQAEKGISRWQEKKKIIAACISHGEERIKKKEARIKELTK